MNRKLLQTASLAAALMLAASPSQAEKPASAGKNNERSHADLTSERKRSHQQSTSDAVYFTDNRARLIRDFYSSSPRPKSCPPGLAKKNNACLPPGQAKKWRVGHPLPSGLDYYDVPEALLHRLGYTPEDQKIVRIGTDLLLISVGTAVVLDALENLDNVY